MSLATREIHNSWSIQTHDLDPDGVCPVVTEININVSLKFKEN